MAISMLKIRRPLGRLIFNMGIAIPGKTVFLIETAPCFRYQKNTWHVESNYILQPPKFIVILYRYLNDNITYNVL